MKTIAIVGKPNSGKSLLFNRLTGLKQKVTNFPGITVDIKRGQCGEYSVSDFPGIYTFEAITQDEVVAVQNFMKELKESRISKILCVLDATNLTASLRIGLEVLHKASKEKVPVVFAINMIDEIQNNGLKIDIESLEKNLKSRVVCVSAKNNQGVKELSELLCEEISPAPESENTDFYERSLKLSEEHGVKTDVLFLKQTRIDKFLLSPVVGGVFFVFIMLMLFQAIFSWSVPFMDMIEISIAWSGAVVSALLPEGVFKDFVNEAIFAGVGSFLVFVPQIFFLTLIIGLLEDTGYLARAAMICHRPLKAFGLSGKSFVPLLTGHACAIPAIFAARSVESPKRRFMTILVVPLMSCSARLPVYALLVAAFIPASSILGGMLGLQGLAFFALYLLGVIMALLASFVLSRTKMNDKKDSPFLLELPPYRLPSLKPLIMRSLQSSWDFISEAGVVIFAVTVVVWILGYFPNGAGEMDSSWLALIGKSFEPFLEPLGLDWKYGVAIVASFVAREVFVGTLGTMFGIEGTDENIVGLVENIQNSGLTFASGMALLVFYAIALQCSSTLVVMKKELNSVKTPFFIFVFYSLLAYVLALLTYQVFN